MQPITAQLDIAFRSAIRAAFGVDTDPLIAAAQNDKFGDYQSNVAMSLAKQVQVKNPRAVAEHIISRLDLADIGTPTIAGPGFINIKLSPAWVTKSLEAIAGDERLGISPIATPQTIVIDYSGPNIAKEMHVGHLRGTIIGDCFARVLSFVGHRVIRQNHIGDWGLQMGMVTYAVEQDGSASVSLADLDRMYKRISQASKDPTVRKDMAARTSVLQATPKEQLTIWRQVRELTLAAVAEMYGRMDVLLQPEDVRGESSYSDVYPKLVADLIAQGIAQDADGAIGIFATGFSNREGEPRPFIIRSRDGSYQYPTFDLAALTYRVRTLHANRIIYTHDNRQADHFAMLFAVARQLGLDQIDGNAVRFDYAPFGTLLGEDGKPLKSRSGDNVKLTELLDEAEQRASDVVVQRNPNLPAAQQQATAHAVGIGAIKYADLSKDRTSDYIFSFDKMLTLDGNTAPYLQYAYARICSIFRKAAEEGATAGPLRLDAPQEMVLATHLLRFSEVIELVARDLRPHHLCAYLYELATKFSGFYENCPVLKSESEVRGSRLRLCGLTRATLALGLELLGIQHPEEM